MKDSHLSKLKGWTLFLDRDGVINERKMTDYVRSVSEFRFLPGVLAALRELSVIFGRIIIVTNQQGIGKGLMTEEDLRKIHNYMLAEVSKAGGRIDRIYHAPELEIKYSPLRKPNVGMAHMAKKDFPEIKFSKAIMVGDSIGDLEFGRNTGMKTVYLGERDAPRPEQADYQIENLSTLAKPELLRKICAPSAAKD